MIEIYSNLSIEIQGIKIFTFDEQKKCKGNLNQKGKNRTSC